MSRVEQIFQKFEEALARGVFPGAVILVGLGETILLHEAFGFASLIPERKEMTKETLFDIASLTKVVGTTTALMILVRDKMVQLDDRVVKIIPEFGSGKKGEVTLRHLLTHSSGLVNWLPFYQMVLEEERRETGKLGTPQAKRFVYEQIHREGLQYEPGSQAVYSDPGFLILGEIVEHLTEMPLDQFCEKEIFQPLGLGQTFFPGLHTPEKNFSFSQFAATELCPWRKKVLSGEVHDDNAYAMGGVAGHAGIFSTSSDLFLFGRAIIKALKGDLTMFPPSLVETFTTRQSFVEGSSRALGWDTPSESGSASGRFFSKRSIGHLGFTGTSLWIDLQREIIVVLLTNRVHPSRENIAIRAFRPEIHDEVMEYCHERCETSAR